MICETGGNQQLNDARKHISDFNYYDLPQLPLNEELLDTLVEHNDVRIERIVSTGQITDGWYDQEEHEYVVLLEGTAQIEYENGETVDLAPGDTLLIPAHDKHRVSYTSTEPACIWLCVFWR
ncbi:MAG: cupin domain-containing protein [Lachnospiraceae bacterium]